MVPSPSAPGETGSTARYEAPLQEDRRSPAVLVSTPDGEYLVSRDGSGGSSRNAYVISRAQLGEVMTAAGLRRADLADPAAAMRLAGLVEAFAAGRARTDEAPG